jgi:hypothetical protein
VAKKKADSSPAKLKKSPRGSVPKPSKVANAQVSAGNMTEDNKRTGGAAATQRRGISSEMIGQTAGDIWRVLSERGGQSMAGLKKSVDAPEELILAALGWLAREDKLAFETNGRSVTVSLA